MTVKRSDITLEQTYPASIEGRLESISGVVDRSTGALSARVMKSGRRMTDIQQKVDLSL